MLKSLTIKRSNMRLFSIKLYLKLIRMLIISQNNIMREDFGNVEAISPTNIYGTLLKSGNNARNTTN